MRRSSSAPFTPTARQADILPSVPAVPAAQESVASIPAAQGTSAGVRTADPIPAHVATPGSVGMLSHGRVAHVEDLHDPTDPSFPWSAFAKHEQMSSLRSLATLSVARTWRVTSASDPVAGGEGSVTIHCGQPSAGSSLLISVLPLKRRTDGSPEERLERALALPKLPKGATRNLKYGPVCRAGAHIICVTLNGAHCAGSPLHITVSPAPPEASCCDLLPPGAPRPHKGRFVAGVAAGDAGAGGAKHERKPPVVSGAATEEIVVALQLRDRFRNSCANAHASDVAASPGMVAVDVVRVGGEPYEQDGDADAPSALLPPPGSPAAVGARETRLWTPAAVLDEPTPLQGRHGRGRAGGRGGGRGRSSRKSAAGEGDVPDRRGVLMVGLRVARAGVYQVSAQLRGTALASTILVKVSAGPAHPASSTAHSATEGEETSLHRCVAGVSRQLRLVARDALGNATATALHKWSASLQAADANDARGLFGDSTAADGGTAPAAAWLRTPPEQFYSSIALSDAASPATALLSYRVDRAGLHQLTIRLGGHVIHGCPAALHALVPVWGAAFEHGVAGEAAVIYVRIRPEGSTVPGTAASRRLMHALSVEAFDADTHESASVTTRHVLASAALSPQRSDPSVSSWVGGSPCQMAARDAPNEGEDTGEIAEVSLLAASAGRSWSLVIKVDDAHVLGSPFHWAVRPGVPSSERSLVHAAWVGSGKAAAGVCHEGTLVLRDKMGNECEEGAADVVVWMREEFVSDTHQPSLPPSSPSKARLASESVDGKSTLSPAAPMVVEYQEGRRLIQQQATPIGGGRFHIVWRATRTGSHSILIMASGMQLARASQVVDVYADGAISHASELELPASGTLHPQHWNALQLRCRDASSNPSDLVEPSRLAVRCDGLVADSHLLVRERPGLDGAYEVLIFGEPVGWVTLHVTLDGFHVLHSPARLEIAASAATAGRCYAFGAGLGSSGAIALGALSHFTIVACDVTGVRRCVGGDPFRVVIVPRKSAHHLSLRVKLHDGGSGAYTVSWTPPFSGGYEVFITLRGLPIFGSPFRVSVQGSNTTPAAAGLARATSASALPSAAQTEAAIASEPVPMLRMLRSVPATPQGSPTPQHVRRRAPGLTTAPIATARERAAERRMEPLDSVAAAGTKQQWPGSRAAPARALSAASRVLVSGSGDVRADVERALEAARREGLGDMIRRFKRSVAVDDAEEDHARTLRTLPTGAQGSESDDDADRGVAAATPTAPRTGDAARAGPAFSPD